MSKEGTVNIRGKQYETVAHRVHRFREDHPDWSICTEIIERDEECVVVRAQISNQESLILATGHAEERRNASQINQTSALENAETSAIGRALAALGYGGTEFASANEVQNAIHQQEKKTITPASGVEESLDAGVIKKCNDLAVELVDLFETDGAEVTMAHLDAATVGATHEEKIYVWKQLPAPMRRALKNLPKEKANVE